MSKQNAQDTFAERVAAELIEQLKQGTAPFQKPWSPEMGSDLPYNHSTGNYYRGGNALALMMQHYDDPRWMTYKQAQAVGAQVRKGEKGTQLVKLVTHVERNAKDDNGKVIRDADGQALKERERLENPYLKSFTVFNAEQIDGLPAYDKKAVPVFADHERAEKLLAASGAEIVHLNADRACYAPGSDKIYLPPKEQFHNDGGYYATALHELGHWTGHESRLNRPLMNEFGTPAYAREELRAEISSMMTTRELGIPHDPNQHAAYVENWIQVLKDDPAEIIHASRDAAKIKDFIMAFEQNIEHEKTPAHEAAPEKYYSEKIIDLLCENKGYSPLNFTKTDEKTATIIYTDPARAGSLNPTGEFKMTAQFDDTGRYLALHSGFQTAFDLDARNVNPENAADVFKHFTEEFAIRDRVTAGTPQMMLYGREMHARAQESPEMAAEVRGILPPAAMTTPEEFSARDFAFDLAPNQHLKVIWPAATEQGLDQALVLSASGNSKDAIAAAHRNKVNDYLSEITENGTRQAEAERLSPPEVLESYPELREQYLLPAKEQPARQPARQPADERLQSAKERYLMQSATMTPRELQERRVQEHMLEKVVSGLLPEFQNHARANFYEQPVKQVANRHETAPPQSELSFER